MIKQKFNKYAAVWGPKILFVSVFGVTGLAVMGITHVYKSLEKLKNTDIEITEKDWRNGQS